MKQFFRAIRPLALAILLLAWTSQAHAFQVFAAGGNNSAASIQATVDSFRNAIGSPNNGNASGEQPSGRREINWDVGGSGNIVSGTPFNGFQNNRGVLFTTPGSGFVQAAPAGLATQFGNATYGLTFGVFSPVRLFTPIGSNITEVTFSVGGSNGATPATVNAFGAVFTDVDTAISSKLEYFDLSGNLLTSVFVPPGSTTSASLSFVGVRFDAGERIGWVRITSGSSALGPTDGGPMDIVGIDDLIFGEPRRVQPEPISFFTAIGYEAGSS